MVAVAAAVPVPATINLLAIISKTKNDRDISVIFYLPRRNEISAPNPPTKPKPSINNPTGTRPLFSASSLKVAITNGAGGVKVGKRVGVTGSINAAAKVGSMVGVDANVGVGGEIICGNLPFFTIFT